MRNQLELPKYKVRVSARAKRIIVSVRPDRGVEVVVPKGVNPARAEDVVRAKKEWIDHTLARLGLDVQGQEHTLPHTVELPCLGWSYCVAHGGSGRGRLRLEENQGRRLAFVGRSGEIQDYVSLLQTWLRQVGTQQLSPMLAELSGTTGLSYNRLTVRRQKSRWGSCSARGNISLNCKLLFFPKDLAQYVMLHELAHTRHLNHSRDYWALVEQLAPEWRSCEARLKNAHPLIPWWAY